MKHLIRIVSFVDGAFAASESDTDRDGPLSYHAETHAAGIGIGAGFAAAVFGEVSLLGIVYAAAVHGRLAQLEGKRRQMAKDCRREPAHCLTGVVVGVLLGALYRVASGQAALPIGLGG
jgi:hypothetical protein